MLAGALTIEQAAHALGLTPPELTARMDDGELVALMQSGRRMLPAWQFTNRGARPGLRALLEAWPGTPLSLSLWAVQPNADLDGQAPADVLTRRRGLPRVLEAVRALTPSAW